MLRPQSLPRCAFRRGALLRNDGVASVSPGWGCIVIVLGRLNRMDAILNARDGVLGAHKTILYTLERNDCLVSIERCHFSHIFILFAMGTLSFIMPE